jgi:hypothetical protein
MRGGRLVLVVAVVTIVMASWKAPSWGRGETEGSSNADVSFGEASIPFGQPRPLSDDGWRRTADGWEHVADWEAFGGDVQVAERRSESAFVPDRSAAALLPGWRWDFHPALLALLQMVVVLWLAVRAD